MRLDFDLDDWERRFTAIGSKEFPRAVQYALDETAKLAAGIMQDRMPQVLGRKDGGKWEANSFTLKSVKYQRSTRDYNDVTSTSEISSSVLIAPAQSAYLKYLFGQDSNERRPGDVGLADDTILVPDRENLFYCTRIAGISPFGSGRMPRTLIRDLDALIAKGKSGAVSHSDAMRAMGAVARERGAGFQAGPKLARVDRRLHRSIHTPGRGHESVPTGARDLGRFLKARGIDARDEWRIIRAKDHVSGLTTIQARGPRTRDPQGGTHTFIRRDGTKATMPKMISLSRFDGESGPRLGLRRLFIPTKKATYAPILQASWDIAAKRAWENFPDEMQREFDNKLDRMDRGRSF